jgi:hypothetical protein
MLQAKTDNKTLVQHQVEKNKKATKQAPKEIMEGARNSFMAMSFLQHNKIDEAKKLLTKATENFDKALKANPKLDVVPIEESIEVFEFNAQPKEIEKALKLADTFIQEHKTQDARALLVPLKDEMDINTNFIPMGIYPVATKNALTALEKGDKKAAINILSGAFNMLISQQVIIPLSLLSAQDLVMEASQLDKTKKDEASKVLEEAKLELKKAELLGYTNKKSPEYKAVNDSIDNIQKEIRGENIVEKLYNKLNQDFTLLVHKLKKDKKEVSLKEHKKAQAKVQEVETKESIKAVVKEPIFKKEAKTDENKTIK